MKQLTKKDFKNVKKLIDVVNKNVFSGEDVVCAEMISECDDYVFSKVKEAFPITDEKAIIRAVYFGPNDILFIIAQDFPGGVSLNMVKKEVIDESLENPKNLN